MPAFMKKLSEDDANTNEKEKSPKLMILERQQLLMEILEWDGRLDMLTQAPYPDDDANLPVGSLKGSEAKYHSSKLEFLALKWAVVDQFREYLQYQPFHVKMDNNPLTYVMMSPNLDTTGHHWVTALVGYNMMIEYINGSDNKVADCLSQVTEHLHANSVQELIQHMKACGTPTRADTDDPQLAQEDARVDDKIIVQARALMSSKAVICNVANKHWVSVQAADLVIQHVRGWMTRPREDKTSLSEYLNGKVADADHLAYACHQKDLRMSHGLLYMETHAPGTDEKVFAFVVLAKK